ncbi:hypothetical protein WMY93_019978 [Mugilogobius chulae]|uniref:C2H2-type domain-containing protein n=1 Tax=Mugilogobius chulae TaxID=88201 RepID=A0AAW0NR31_9GOBI
MEKEKICCSICCLEFPEIYQNALYIHEVKYLTPWIFYKDFLFNQKIHVKHKLPALGLSQITVCFCVEENNSLFLCHICKDQGNMSSLESHVFSNGHYENYFANTDPNVLSFAWKSSNFSLSENSIMQKHKEKGCGELQLLHVPAKLHTQCTSKTYREVMIVLHQNKSLSDIFEERKLHIVSIQTYRDDANRKHPLLGLQNLVECICKSPYLMKHYLCTLCGLHVFSSNIIRHVLEFNHLFCYFNKYHPSTLEAKKCYPTYNQDFANTMTDLAKQSEKLHGLGDIQQVNLKPSQVLSVSNACFEEAVRKIESFTKKNNLIPVVKPGNKLEPCTSGNSISESKAGEPSLSRAEQSYRVHCQNCNQRFRTNPFFADHLLKCKHQETFRKNFGQAVDKPTTANKCKPHLPKCSSLIKHDHSYVGMSLVVTIFSHEVTLDPVYLCFACEAVVLCDRLEQHMNSLRHLVQSLIYRNPWRLPFGWKAQLDYNSLKLQACKEEDERGADQQIIRILDVPSSFYPLGANLTFAKVMEKLSKFHPLLMNGVPRCETFSKLQDNDRFPLLGRDFLVKYGQAISGWKFLCLLCKQTLSSNDYAGHVFSWGHVVSFLDKYHPGSLDLHTSNKEILLDLAKQAARIHRVANEQEILFDQSIFEATDYNRKVHLLSAQMTRCGKGLIPCITPTMKLVARQRQTHEKDLSLSAGATQESKVEKIESISEKHSEKAADVVQSTDQESSIQTVETMEISLQEKCQDPIQQEIKKQDLPDVSAPIENIVALKRPRCSEMDTSDPKTEDVSPKQRRTSAPENEMGNQKTNETGECDWICGSVAKSVPHYGSLLWSYIKKKPRKPVIGLSEVYECVFKDHAPIYLCRCCSLQFKEHYIDRHVSETWHYKNYLERMGEHPLLQGKNWRSLILTQAATWERNKGYGHAQVVEMTSEEFSKLSSTSEYHIGIRIVKKHLSMEEENKKNLATANLKKTTQEDEKMEIDSEPSEPVTAPSQTDLLSKTNSKSNEKMINENESQGPETSIKTTAAATLSCNLTTPTFTAATPAICTSSKSLTDPKDRPENTGQHVGLKVEDETPTVAPKPSNSDCQILTNEHVFPDADSKKSEESRPTLIDEETGLKTGDETPAVAPKPSNPDCQILTNKHVFPDADSKKSEESTLIDEETGLKTGDETPTVTPKPIKSVCKFITIGHVFPKIKSKTASTDNNNSDKLEHTTTASTSTDSPDPTSKYVCRFMTAKFANSNMSTTPTTHLEPPPPDGIAISSKSSAETIHAPPSDSDVTSVTQTTALSTSQDSSTVTDCTLVCDANVSKHAPNLQDVVVKRKADSDMACAIPFKVALSDNNTLSVKNAAHTDSSKKTIMPSAAPAQSTPKILDNHSKPSEKQLKLNVNAASHITKTGTVDKICSLTPTTPSCDSHPTATEVSGKTSTTMPKIGMDLMLKVSCKESQHVYCFACSVKLERSDHLTSTIHQINCVKAKYPEWGSKPDDKKLSDMVTLIAETEKSQNMTCKFIEVPLDVYKELKGLPDNKAIEKVQGMIRKKSSKKSAQRRLSSEASPNYSVSPYEATSPDIGKENSATKPKPKCFAEPLRQSFVSSPNLPVQKPTSKVAPRIIKGSTTDVPSTLCHILRVKNRPVIGLSFVWECRVVPPGLPTFYLCESCCQTIKVNEICDHMISVEHNWNYILKQYPMFMMWRDEEFLPEMKDELTNDIAGWVLGREELMDAQTVLLSEEWFEWVRAAPFGEALNVVKRIRQEKKNTTLPLIVRGECDESSH